MKPAGETSMKEDFDYKELSSSHSRSKKELLWETVSILSLET